jgi:hypothetical protein
VAIINKLTFVLLFKSPHNKSLSASFLLGKLQTTRIHASASRLQSTRYFTSNWDASQLHAPVLALCVYVTTPRIYEQEIHHPPRLFSLLLFLTPRFARFTLFAEIYKVRPARMCVFACASALSYFLSSSTFHPYSASTHGQSGGMNDGMTRALSFSPLPINRLLHFQQDRQVLLLLPSIPISRETNRVTLLLSTRKKVKKLCLGPSPLASLPLSPTF